MDTAAPTLFSSPPRLTKPGLFITGTDTGVGKTAAACAVAWNLRRAGMRVGVCKPFATGCRRERGDLVSEDAEALAHFADCRQSLAVINPVRFALPASPAVAAEHAQQEVDFDAIARSLTELDRANDCVLVEGVGGLLVPIDPRRPRVTVLDLIRSLGYPVAVVCRATLGTLNHTAMTVRLLHEAHCSVAGLIVNGYEPDVAKVTDPSMHTNRRWLEKMNGVKILATVPGVPAGEIAPEKGLLPPAIVEAVGMSYWPDLLSSPLVRG
ncbi:MAG: dethiobiotin synthase [Planctomycetes bacterium]|nr:dethiobiotin synthase [Planctomycetota bacterium]